MATQKKFMTLLEKRKKLMKKRDALERNQMSANRKLDMNKKDLNEIEREIRDMEF